ncbi:MAG: DNA helicase II, partial [Proteobacteria bacterium]|nr:DNA helicase II [Pseudomonadota bacterium]
SEVIEFTINVSGLIEYYNNEKDGIDRIENLRELVNAGMVFEAENTLTRVDITASDASSKFDSVQDEGNLLPSFLAYASLESGEHQASDGSKALQLMTVHAAKGLEFDTVFLTGLEEGLFPHENSLNDTSGLEEERRLMYVAITRAKKTLFISHAQSRMLHGQTRWNMPSRFLEEIPGENVQKSNVEFTSILPRTSQFEDLPPNGKNKLPNGLRIGLTVEHGKFGVGVIVQAEGQGNDTRVQVNFENFGNKWLVLSFAKLKTIGKN